MKVALVQEIPFPCTGHLHMATTVNSATATTIQTVTNAGSPTLQQMKSELTAALVAAGVTDARTSDAAPMGFPRGVNWSDAYRMVARRAEDGNPATPGNLVLSAELLKSNLSATRTLAAHGVTDLARFPPGTSVTGAIDALYRDTGNGKLASVMARAGIYDLSAFPSGTSAFAAFKLIEDPDNPGKISIDRYKDYRAANTALQALGITSLANFPRGATALDARQALEPKADLMLSMLGVSKDNFRDPGIASLTALSILTRLPGSLQQMKSLPAGQSADRLALQAVAAKQLVAAGYDSLAPFATMGGFAGKTVTPRDALAVLQQRPAPADLPQPTSASTERLFQPTFAPAKRSYGQPNPVTLSVLNPSASQLVKPSPPPTTTVLTASQALEFNRSFWAPRR